MQSSAYTTLTRGEKMKKVTVFDSTLRDGAQAEGISFSVEDKIKIVKALDKLGVTYIEAGNPGSNPKDLEFFKKISNVTLTSSKIVAFGSTRRCGIKVEDDTNVKSLLSANTEVVAIFGKSWDFHVTDIIHTTPEENLNMIRDTISYLVSCGKEVIFDAEHFFDGYKANPVYALKTLEVAEKAGAKVLALCDTNGGSFPHEIDEIVSLVSSKFNASIGIHCHNDCGMAVANSIMSVRAGATHIQGTFTGFGERCGNAHLCTIIADLQVKAGYNCIPEENIKYLTHTARKISEIANYKLVDSTPFVGKSAFAHKGGMHIDGVCKAPHSFEHINPEIVGNERKFLTSEVSGKSTIISLIQKVDPTIEKNSKETELVIERLKELEFQGYQFEGADGGFELLIRKSIGKYKPFFKLVNYKIIGENPPVSEDVCATALIKIIVDGQEEITAAEGRGPVNALDKALRKALEVFYPSVANTYLTDYKVRVLDSKTATASKVRVLIETSDGIDSWTTVGVSVDIIEASWIALVDSIEYKLIKDIECKFKTYL